MFDAFGYAPICTGTVFVVSELFKGICGDLAGQRRASFAIRFGSTKSMTIGASIDVFGLDCFAIDAYCRVPILHELIGLYDPGGIG